MGLDSVLVADRAHMPHAQVKSSRPATTAEALGKNASLGMWAVGGLFMIGSLIDLAVLWLLQRQESPQWEYVAVANTLEALPRFGLAVAFFFAALHFRRSTSMGMYRVVGALMVVLGLFAAVLGVIAVTDYYVLAEFAQGPDALGALQSTSAKAVALSALYFWTLVPLGVLAARRPRE